MAKAKRKPVIDVEQERALLAKARDGDKRAMERLIAAHYPAMYHLALRYTRDPERALDATQESCVQVIRHLGQFRSEARFSSWMARIVINSARLRYRSDKRLVPMADGVWMDSVADADSGGYNRGSRTPTGGQSAARRTGRRLQPLLQAVCGWRLCEAH